MICYCCDSTIRILRVLILFVGILFHTTPIFADDSSSERENKIKIAYLYHFAQFTEWTTKPSTFNYCVYEDTSFSELLKNAYAGKNFGDTIISVHPVYAQSDFDNCQLIFFPHSVSAELLTKLNKKPILSVGTQRNFAQVGGIISLFEDNQKIYFFINNITALNSGLKINSQLLSLSKEPPL
jgi:hypothetical protein